MKRVIAVDIGNSNIVVGLFAGKELKLTGRMVTRRDYTASELRSGFEKILEGFGEADGAIISSVVPQITDEAAEALEEITGCEVMCLSEDLDTGIDLSRYDEGSIGTDRIVDLAAAASLYDGPVMTCDLGTCTTITVADEEGMLLGGMICAGVQLSLDAEAARASQLPRLRACKTYELLGTDTETNMISGAVAGAGIMISGIIDRVCEQYDLSDLNVVITGGLGEYVIPWIDKDVHYEPDLLLKGLLSIYERNSEVEFGGYYEKIADCG